MTNQETAEKVPAEDFGAAEHLAAIERMYQEGLAHIAFLAQSWARPAATPAAAPVPPAPARHAVPMTTKPMPSQQKTAA